ncbi:MAG TPA: bifunctional hydroxymethylpyrimidine kinase/phosphomethylpyrimidine kinase, partial [Marinilabiliaceae bacterium]|nr:bifunctional hydroxymethylpyrimidine kinase/phosphomethylpyrimidine kinase [Marinilabiliaceae bacterium]
PGNYPNIPEAEILLGRKILRQSDLPDISRELSHQGTVSVLLKAGHFADEELVDVFYNAETDEIIKLPFPRIATKNTHGTGCTLSSAVAAFLAQGLPLNEAIGKAKAYIHNALVEGANYQIGKGNGRVHHFHALWQ